MSLLDVIDICITPRRDSDLKPMFGPLIPSLKAAVGKTQYVLFL